MVRRRPAVAARPAEPPPAGADERLSRYRAKRDFGRTAEPAGAEAAAAIAAGHRFVVHKHAARRLHYDLRLELGGVLKSWAVTRGPSFDPNDRRLAVHVEDHPLDYRGFEGPIPKGEYGGGTVMLWDEGGWEPQGDEPAAELAQGRLKFRLFGQKLQGGWTLVRMGGKAAKEKKDLWLLIKERDEAAADGGTLPDDDRSVASGRTMEEIAAGSPAGTTVAGGARADGRGGARRHDPKMAPPPEFVPPQLTQLTATAPDGQDWLHEIKLDGYRAQIRIVNGSAAVRTRNGHDWSDRFGVIAREAGTLPLRQAILDGEIVVQDQRGVSSFTALREALERGADSRMVAFLFDLLHLDGEDLRPLPLLERKRRLETFLGGVEASNLRFSDHVVGSGPEVFRLAGRLGAEGIVAKRVEAPYRSGRGGDWRKVKCTARQELVVGGFTPRQGARSGLGALVTGVYEANELVHVGRVGTGWSERDATRILAVLEPLRQERMPFQAVPALLRRSVRWVRPERVVEATMAGWTGDGQVRHASFLGWREDKDPGEVVRERPAAVSADRPVGEAPTLPRVASRKVGRDLEIEGVRITHPDRVVLDQPHLTKADVAHYYATVAERLLEGIGGRPLSLIRCPEHLGDGCFFQRHRAAGMAQTVRAVPLDGSRDPGFAVDDARGVLALVQFGASEFHPWGARADRPDRPDRIVIDLDPAPEVAWPQVVAAAHEVRERLRVMRLESFARTTGGKGLHVVMPIDRRYDWPQVKTFAGDLARAMAGDSPRRYTATLAKSARRGRIFVDYLRNDRMATAVASWSLRARPGAPVAVPVAWEEVEGTLDPACFTIATAAARLRRDDPWAGIDGLRQRLPKGRS